MADCLGKRPNINPAYTFDITNGGHLSSSTSLSTGGTSNGDGSNSANSADSDEDSNEKSVVKRKRKRKSYSSLAEMLKFLETSEKKEKS